MKNIYQKLNDVQKIVQTVYKTSTIAITQYKSYSAVSHDEVAGILHMPLANAGIFVQVSMTNCKIEQIETDSTYNNVTTKKISYMATVEMEIKFINSDDPSDFFITKQTAYAFDASDKAIGKAQSMAVKYAYLKNLNLESMDEEEQRPELKFAPKEQQRPTPAKVVQPEIKKPLEAKPEVKAHNRIEETIEEIKTTMRILTLGQNIAEKGETMRNILKVHSFSDLSKKPLRDLEEILANITSQQKENDVKKKEPEKEYVKKPSFVINT